jgi:acetyl-CoA carboxylase biotin carboxyl carrier protein
MDLKEIKKLISLMNQNGLTRLEVEEGDRRYLLEKGLAPAAPHALSNGYQNASMMPPPPPLVAAAPMAAARSSGPEDTKTFNSPMVGTFYRCPSPDAEAFVKPGDHVEPETVLCLIEAMKVFNEIKAEMSGTIVEVLADDKEAVEYNQPLFLIRPA